jgi:GDP-L-fucose synthase
VLRPSAVYGPCDDFDPVTAHVIPALIRKVVARLDPLEVWGTGQEERDLVFVGDLVEAMLLAAARCEGHAVCNIGAGQSHTVREVVEALVELDGFVGARIQFDASKPTTIPKRRISIDRAANLLGWQPRTTLAEGLRRTLEWYRQNSP